jgi:hypothetical protein
MKGRIVNRGGRELFGLLPFRASYIPLSTITIGVNPRRSSYVTRRVAIKFLHCDPASAIIFPLDSSS